VLRKTFGPKSDEVTGEWRRLHNEELYTMHSSTNIIRVIKSRKMRWAVHVARGRERRGDTGLWCGNRRAGDNVEDQGADVRIILKCMLEEWVGGTDWMYLAQDRDRRRTFANAVMNPRVS
jgi:hypothetical protein